MSFAEKKKYFQDLKTLIETTKNKNKDKSNINLSAATAKEETE
jgi:hypothetical protein